MKYQQLVILGLACLLFFGNTYKLSSRYWDRSLLTLAPLNDDIELIDQHSVECFNYYKPLLRESLDKYHREYAKCLAIAEDARFEADKTIEIKIQQLLVTTKKICEFLNQCNEIYSAERKFQCYIDELSSKMKEMHTINDNASDDLADLRDEYYVILSLEHRCTNSSKRIYDREVAEITENLNNCVLGLSPVPIYVQQNKTSDRPTTIETEETEASEDTTYNYWHLESRSVFNNRRN